MTRELTPENQAIEIVEDSEDDITAGRARETSLPGLLPEEVVSDHENDADVGELSEGEAQPVKVRKVQKKGETRGAIKEYRKTSVSSVEGET
jgi:hypothetical protein